jgi:metal-responsive CopG/Arc/MetJ family transcriptional regulator
LSDARLSEQITYRETKRIVDIVDRVAKDRGLQRSYVIREALRTFLADHISQSRRRTSGSADKLGSMEYHEHS